jgi:hypothetical protein
MIFKQRSDVHRSIWANQMHKRVLISFITAVSDYWLIGTISQYRGADKSLARPGRKQATATEDFAFHISYL